MPTFELYRVERKRHKKQCLHISRDIHNPAVRIQDFVRDHNIRTLNVAGSRESKEPGIYNWVMQVLEKTFFPTQRRPGNPGRPKSE